MDNIIKQVIESEYRAQKIIDEAENEQKQAADNIEKEILKVKDEIFLSARQKADSLRVTKIEQAKAQVDEIMSAARDKVYLMQRKLEENRSIWVQDLVDYVIKR